MTNKWVSLLTALAIILAAGFSAQYLGLFDAALGTGSASSENASGALSRAEEYLNTNSRDYDPVLRKNTLQEYNFGWIIFYTNADHARDTNPPHDIHGSGILVINRDGEVIDLGPRKKIEPIIIEYTKVWSRRQ
ncbi:MAG: hypothetical protein WAX38_02725 [Minisyncoccia bacterium]